MDATRRKLVLSTLFGAGGLGLRALATGIPASVLASLAAPRVARADTGDCAPDNAQFIFLLTSGSGDPMNANVPGTYDNPDVYHGDTLGQNAMAPTDMTFGSRTVKGAKAWAQLPAEILARTAFIHHATYTNSHGDAAKVNRLQGAVKRQEMTVSMFAKYLQGCLGTVQQQPIVVANNLITYAGSVQPVLSPPSLAAVLAAPKSPLLDLQQIRDRHLDELNALLKASGTEAQRGILDRYAVSQTQARTLSQDLLADLATIRGGDRLSQNTAAAVLFKMNVSPVAVGSFSFGGDNHGDNNLAGEARETLASTSGNGMDGGIVDLWNKLKKYGLQDKVTMAFQNVFGRTLKLDAHDGEPNGRNHNSNHHCTILIGKNVKASVIGGIKLTPNKFDFQATGIDSASGLSNDGGDIPYLDTFGSVGKTFGRAVGVSQAILDDQITQGKVITAALA